MLNENKLTLSEFLDIIKGQFDDIIGYYEYILEAEVKSVKQNRQFYYFELVEIKNGRILDSSRANIFNPRVMLSFLHSTWISDVSELVWKKLLFTVKPTFHRTYNFSINISKIHSDYFIWWLEQQKKENINKLVEKGIFKNNHELNLWYPDFKIAVITWDKSEWFRDFKTILDESGYNYNIDIYSSLVNWEKASIEVLQRLKEISIKWDYNMVAIIRWWWGSEWMNWANDYELCYEVCNYNIPVMSAVGHTVDKSILDMVSYFDCKTPSEAAKKIIDIYYDYKKKLDTNYDFINNMINDYSNLYKKDLLFLSKNLPLQISSKLRKYEHDLKILNIDKKILYQKKLLKNNLKNLYLSIKSNSPDKILSKWYSIVVDNTWKIPISYNVGDTYIMKTFNYNYQIKVESIQKRD